jgi:predicted phage terminase large subunit-like protein
VLASLPSLADVQAERCRRDLGYFTRQAWGLVEPGRRFVSNWHIDAIAEHLEAISRRDIHRLVINIPPRCMKSLSVAVFWPAWEWLDRPETRWLCASYAAPLATRDSVKMRRLIQSQGAGREDPERTLIERLGYRGLLRLLHGDEAWELVGDVNLKTRFENTQAGYRLATSVGGGTTGEGGDIVVIDDAAKAEEGESDVRREEVTEWHDGTISTRLNDPKTGAEVVIMQRLHETDLAGHLLTQDEGIGDWTHLCLPMEYEPSHPFVWPDDPRTEPGELLWPERVGPTEVDRLKRQLGSYKAAGQLQQRPAPEEGGIIKTAWWRYYPREWQEGEEWGGPPFQRIWQSWDTALKDKTSNDYTVGQLWGQDLAQRFLLRQVRGRFAFTEALEQVQQMHAWAAQRFPKQASHLIFVENTAMGPELIASARRKIQGLVPITADRDKVSRAYAITPQLEAGNVVVPGAANRERTSFDPVLTPAWVQETITECSAFPNAAFDDIVDALTQGLDPRRLTGKHHRSQGEQKSRMGGVRDKPL